MTQATQVYSLQEITQRLCVMTHRVRLFPYCSHAHAHGYAYAYAKLAQGKADSAKGPTAAEAQRMTQEAQAKPAQLEVQLAAQLADLAAKKTARGSVATYCSVLTWRA